MERGTRNLLIGCGIGCGLLILGFVAVGGGGFFMIKRMVDKAERIEAATDAVAERYGRIVDYRPAADGTIAAARIEAFLAVRQRIAAERDEMNDRLGKLADMESGGVRKSPDRVFQAVRAGAGLIPQIMDYVTARSEALLAEGVSLGEYLYLYTLVYYADLGNSPADGPPFTLTDGDYEDDDEYDRDDDRQDSPPRERRERRIRRQLNAHLLPMLTNQLADLTSDGRPADERWRRELETEIATLRAAPLRLPWTDGLPSQTATSLAPFRARLRASYCELCNPLEVLGMSER